MPHLERIFFTLGLALLSMLCCLPAPAAAEPELPLPMREFRAAWVATVANIDWPSKPGLASNEQQREFERIVDRAAELNLNALILQVRPAADALFPSAFEPWSPYLTGTMGQAPDPLYDPLKFAVETAHRHGIELHVWFNPYRALHKSFTGNISDDHISKTMPAAVKEYGGYLWLDPGDQQASQHSLDVMLDVVRRYDIDGIHMDDYFYPYPVTDAAGNEIPFPDDESFAAARQAGYSGRRNDWRRSNVDALIQRLHMYTKRMKPWVRIGISPFGIWRPGHPRVYPRLRCLRQTVCRCAQVVASRLGRLFNAAAVLEDRQHRAKLSQVAELVVRAELAAKTSVARQLCFPRRHGRRTPLGGERAVKSNQNHARTRGSLRQRAVQHEEPVRRLWGTGSKAQVRPLSQTGAGSGRPSAPRKFPRLNGPKPTVDNRSRPRTAVPRGCGLRGRSRSVPGRMTCCLEVTPWSGTSLPWQRSTETGK